MAEPAEIAELLLEGARYGDLEDCQQALDQGSDVDSRDSQGRTGSVPFGRCSCRLSHVGVLITGSPLCWLCCSASYGKWKRALGDRKTVAQRWRGKQPQARATDCKSGCPQPS